MSPWDNNLVEKIYTQCIFPDAATEPNVGFLELSQEAATLIKETKSLHCK